MKHTCCVMLMSYSHNSEQNVIPNACHSHPNASAGDQENSVLVYTGVCQQVKRKKEAGENRIRPGRKRAKVRYPKVKEKEAGSKGQSILTQVLDKGRFLRLGESLSLNPGKTLELRCKGTKIGWAYPSYLDTFNDNRLRYPLFLRIQLFNMFD